MHITMDLASLLAVYGVIVGAGSFAIAVARSRNNGKPVVDGNGKPLALGRVLEVISGKISDFRENTCTPARKETEKLFEIQQNMYRVELKAAADVLHGEVAQIANTLTIGLENIDGRIERIEGKIEKK